MWSYERRLQFPVNIKETNPKLAMVIMSQFGGPDGELAASMRYLSQRFATALGITRIVGILYFNNKVKTFCSISEKFPHRIQSVIGFNCLTQSKITFS